MVQWQDQNIAGPPFNCFSSLLMVCIERMVTKKGNFTVAETTVEVICTLTHMNYLSQRKVTLNEATSETHDEA